jgi:hypothetical protein
MKRIFIFVCVSVMALTMSANTYAEAPYTPPKTVFTQQEVRELAIYYANTYKVNERAMLLTIDQESSFRQYANGDSGRSKGACQIHDSNKIPTSDRYNPEFCLNWTAQKIAQGQARMWTGYRICVLHEKVYHKGQLLKCTADGEV